MIINLKLKHLHIHVPKTGGTSFRDMMIKNGWEGKTPHSTMDNLRYEENWEQYLNFNRSIMIRNPWEHAVSFYGFLLNKKIFNIKDFDNKRKDFELKPEDITSEDVTFKKYIKNSYKDRHFQSYYTKELTDLGLTFNQWFDYSNFEDMLIYFENNYNVKLNRDIRIHDKKTFEYVIDFDVLKPYQSYYDEETYDIVKNLSKKEIEIFDYKF